jgi:hypothetical protein
MDQHDHMPDPDWVRVMVHPDQKKKAVGDPTLWGNVVRVLIDDDPVLPPNGVYTSPQIVLAQASDHYTRSWSLTGAVTAPNDVWNDPNPFPPPASLVQPAGPRLSVYLAISQGSEKVTIEQVITLLFGGDVNNVGLCNNQSSAHGGPYLPGNTADLTQQTRPFAAIGALIGNTVNVRALLVRSLASGGIVPNVTISAMITPYAPGAGL